MSQLGIGGCTSNACCPCRRNASAGQPFLEVDQGSVFGPELGLADQLPVQAINAGAAVLEKALSRPLFPIR